MELKKMKIVYEKVDVMFSHHIHLPAWAFAGRPCEVCGYEIGGDELCPDNNDCILAQDENGHKYIFHDRCFKA